MLATNASGSFASLFNVSYGADGQASTGALAYTLGIGVVGADSGLDDTLTGNSVFLFLSNGGTTITGKEGTSLADAGTGDTVFVISVNAATGVVTLDQQRAVIHTPDTGPDQAVTLADGVITLTATAKDGDLDTASRTENVGDRFIFKDDAPSITVEDASGTYAAGAARRLGSRPRQRRVQVAERDAGQLRDRRQRRRHRRRRAHQDGRLRLRGVDHGRLQRRRHRRDGRFHADLRSERRDLRPPGDDPAHDDHDLRHLAGVADRPAVRTRCRLCCSAAARREPTTSCSSASFRPRRYEAWPPSYERHPRPGGGRRATGPDRGADRGAVPAPEPDQPRDADERVHLGHRRQQQQPQRRE